MKLLAARQECERWLAYLDRQRDKALALQKIATARRNGTMSLDEAREQMREIDDRSSVTVYDGAKLERAVKALLRHTQEEED